MINLSIYNKSGPQQEIATSFINEYIKNNQNKEFNLIIDVGCGVGKTTKEIIAKIPHKKIIGFDVNPDMIKFATEFNKSEDIIYKTCHLIADYQDFKFNIGIEDNEADLVTAIFSLHWVGDNLEKAIRNIIKIMASGSSCLIVVPKKYFSVTTEAFIEDPKWSQYFENYKKLNILSDDELESKLNEFSLKFGFEVEMFNSFEIKTLFNNYNEYKDFITSICSLVPYIEEERRTEFLDDFHDYFRKTDFVKNNLKQIDGKLVKSGAGHRVILKKL